MKKYVFLAFFALIAFVVKAQDESGDLVKEGQQMPAFTIVNDNGKQVPSSSLKRKVILVNFFATWCPPCRGEMPDIEELYNEYGKNNNEIIILGVASPNLGREGSEDDVIKFLEENNYTFPVVMDFGGELVYKYDISGFPTTFIINDEGEIVKRFVGAMDKKNMITIIENAR